MGADGLIWRGNLHEVDFGQPEGHERGNVRPGWSCPPISCTTALARSWQ